MASEGRALGRQIVFYGAVGLVGTLGHYLFLGLLVEFFEVVPVVASSMGFILGALINHELNRKLVFRATTNNRRTTMSRFMIIAGLGFVVNLAAMALLTVLWDAHYFLAQLLATGAVFAMTFIFNKAWTFNA